ncbi:MAG: c-type cytochrome [Planctomycetaceae bacterium]|nr:c-type cytochrome [Planctomycetaceae bacterium]
MPRLTALLLLLTMMPPLAALAEPFTQAPEVAPSQDRLAAEKPAAAEPKKEPESLKSGPKAKWIWGQKPAGNDDVYFLEKTFEGASIQSAHMIASGDNEMAVSLNGRQVLSSGDWQQAESNDVSRLIQPGQNTLSVRVANKGGAAGFALKLAFVPAKGEPAYVVTDESWTAKKKKDDKTGTPAVVVGTMGDGPWGDVFASSGGTTFASRVPHNVFETLPGYKVERIFTVPKEELGSWVCITTDDKGRLIVSDQGNLGLCRITPSPIGSDEPTKVEKIDVKMSGCQGMLYAFGKLYCSVNGGVGSGFYAVEDTDGDDQFDKVTLLKAFQGGGEHGPHSIRLSPDGKSLYVIAGNHTDPPKDFDASRLPSNWSEDLLLPRQWDARGHARGKLAPGGWIAKTDPEGKTWEIVSSGYRNPYDMAFNADGELFAYDADMEWDVGTPWYRPTRVVHATSGSEFGWRSGTGKWPVWTEDSLPPAVNIGPGSPVGVTFGYGAKFPADYQKALFILDWTFGTIYAIHFTPEGSTYTARKEEFLSRAPLPLTDAVIGADGALYFTIGGRGTQSELFRVTYTGDESTAPVDASTSEHAAARKLRQQLEALHHPGDVSAAQMELIWQNLTSADRFLRYAARVALEQRPVDQWREKIATEKDAWRTLQLAIALARQGKESDQPAILAALDRLSYADLEKQQQLALLRAYTLAFVRQGAPDQQYAAELARKLDAFYPAKSDDLNRELSRVLVYLNSPTVITKTLKLMEQPYERSTDELSELLARNPGYGGTIAKYLANQPELQNIHYALMLRNLKYGWTLEQRKQFVQWIEKAKGWSGGASYTGFLDNIRTEALANATEAELKAIESSVVTYRPPSLDELPKPKGPGRDWTVAELLELTSSGLTGRNFENGRTMYAASQCVRCHRYLGEGGATGPDLTNVAGRFGFKDLGESLIEPSKVVSDQYRASTIVTVNGKVINGRILNNADGKLTVLTDPVDATKVVELSADEVDEITPSKVSLMPKDLLDTLSADEVLDLLAYLYSRGNPNDRMFSKE